MRVRTQVRAGFSDTLNVQPDKADASTEEIKQVRVAWI